MCNKAPWSSVSDCDHFVDEYYFIHRVHVPYPTECQLQWLARARHTCCRTGRRGFMEHTLQGAGLSLQRFELLCGILIKSYPSGCLNTVRPKPSKIGNPKITDSYVLKEIYSLVQRRQVSKLSRKKDPPLESASSTTRYTRLLAALPSYFPKSCPGVRQ